MAVALEDHSGKPKAALYASVPTALRVVLGFFGGLQAWPFTVAAVVVLTRRHTTLAELAGLLGFLLGGVAAGCAAGAKHPVLRILAWAVAGSGAGMMLEAILVGGFGVGTVLTAGGLLGAVFADAIACLSHLPAEWTWEVSQTLTGRLQ